MPHFVTVEVWHYVCLDVAFYLLRCGITFYNVYAASCTPATARPLGSFFPCSAVSQARASAVEQATLGTLGTLRAAD